VFLVLLAVTVTGLLDSIQAKELTKAQLYDVYQTSWLDSHALKLLLNGFCLVDWRVSAAGYDEYQ
jgi:hypothetical protein